MQKTTTKSPRKTAKYYRDILTEGTLSEAVSVLGKVIDRFGYKDKYGRRWLPFSAEARHENFNWNHGIEKLFIGHEDKKVYAGVYWQGDLTDGYDSVLVSRLMYSTVVIPAVHEFDGCRTYEEHGDLRVTPDELRNAIKTVVKEYLTPDAIKARKEADRRSALHSKVFETLDEKFRRNGGSAFWNGRLAVQKLLEKEDALLDKEWNELEKIVLTVFKKNNREVWKYDRFVPDLTY